MTDSDLTLDIYNAVRFIAADLCDVAAQRTALMTKVGDAWSEAAYRLRDEDTPFVLHTHQGLYNTYQEYVDPPGGLFPVALGAGALIEYLGLFGLPSRLEEDPRLEPYAADAVAAMLDFLIAPALCTWVAAAVATTTATWEPERDMVLAAEAAVGEIGQAMVLTAGRMSGQVSPKPTQGSAPVIGSAALAVRRMLEHPEDGALIEGARCDLAAVLARLEATA